MGGIETVSRRFREGSENGLSSQAGDIEALERKPTTRQLFGWLSARSPASLRLVTILLWPWRAA